MAAFCRHQRKLGEIWHLVCEAFRLIFSLRLAGGLFFVCGDWLRISDLKQPTIQIVKGRKTIYVANRRFLLPADFSDLDLPTFVNDALPPRDPSKRDTVRQMLVGKDFVTESVANAIGAALSILIPKRYFFLIACLLVAINAAIYFLAERAFSAALLTHQSGNPILALIVTYISISSLVLWHEFGHCAAARKCAIRVDAMGGGFLLIFPSLFTKVSLIHLLSRYEKIIVFMGGIIFQAIASLLIVTIFWYTGSPVAKTIFLANIYMALFNLIPLMKLDGYRVGIELLAHYNVSREKNPNLFKISYIVTTLFLMFMIYSMSRSIIRSGTYFYVHGNYLALIWAVAQIFLIAILIRATYFRLRRRRRS